MHAPAMVTVAERYLINDACPHCGKPVYADEGYYSTTGAHTDCHKHLPPRIRTTTKQCKSVVLTRAEDAARIKAIAGESGRYEWAVTAPNPRHPGTGYDAGQRGWRLHLVEGGKVDWVMRDRYKAPALCGLIPSHGWGMDLFIDTPCARCEAVAEKLGIEVPSIASA